MTLADRFVVAEYDLPDRQALLSLRPGEAAVRVDCRDGLVDAIRSALPKA